MDLKEVINSTGVSKERIQSMNVDLDLDNLKVGDKINFDAGSLDAVSTVNTNADVTANFRKAAIESGGSPQDFMNTVELDTSGQATAESLLAPKDISTMTAREAQVANRYQEWINSKPVKGNIKPPDSFGSNIIEGIKKEVTDRYNFTDAPISSSLKAVQDIGTASQIIDPQVPEDIYGSSGYSPAMYVGAGVSDMEVSAIPTGNRNFSAYANMGQYGSTSRIYDTILMNPVSTWSRDLSSRFS